MEWINYHHLLYFWTTVREGSISAASAKLRLAPSTVSAQLRMLETVLDERLFVRGGRELRLTEVGRVVFRYAEDIFALGRELLDTLRSRPVEGPILFTVGIVDALPKLVAHRLLAPALKLARPVRLVCVQGKPDDLLAQLVLHQLDLVLSDAPLGPRSNLRAFNHELGECGISFFGTPTLVRRLRRRFPSSLDGAPLLLPTTSTLLRRNVDRWLDGQGIRPVIVSELEDSALLKVFGQAGVGVFPAPTAIEREIRRQYHVGVVGRVPEIRERLFAISVERRLKHPAVIAIATAASSGFGR